MSGPATQKARLPNCVLLRFTAHGSGSSSEGAKLAYIRVGRSKHDKVREVRRASTLHIVQCPVFTKQCNRNDCVHQFHSMSFPPYLHLVASKM